MKKIRLLIAAMTVLIIVYGWFSFVRNKGSLESEYKNNIRQADQWVEEGLYQRAINNYELAIEYNDSEENWDKMFDAYEARMKEDPEFFSSYVDALTKAMEAHPTNSDYVEQMVDLLMEKGRYQRAYDVLVLAEDNGATSMLLDQKKLECGYQYNSRYSEYQSFHPFSGGFYSVRKDDLYSFVDSEGKKVEQRDFVYLSQPNDDGVHVRTDERDSRLIGAKGIVLGLFEIRVEECGLFRENLIPVQTDGKFAYYDAFAKNQFGDYERAGTFQDGRAAVMQDGTWGIIDASGAFVSEDRYADIVLDGNGFYMSDDIIIASDGVRYTFYNSKWEPISSFSCERIDRYAGTDLFAFLRDGKWGFVTSKGEVIVEPEYDEARSFSNGVAAVRKNDKWGFITPDNQVVVGFIFDNADYFNEEGSCMVQVPSAKDETVLVWKMIMWKVKR